MSRTFALSAHYPASVERVHAAFADRQYWLARLADSGADSAALDAMTVDADGIDVATTQRINRDQLPALAAQFHPGDLEVVRGETWGPVRDGQARARITGRIVGAPAKVSGEAVLMPDGTGCTLSFTAAVQVDIPLLGGKIESFIGAQLSDLMTAEQDFTAGWLDQRGQPPG